MNYFKQGSFYYGKRKDGKYTQITTFNGLALPHLSVVSLSTANYKSVPTEYVDVEITAREFKDKFAECVSLIAGFNICVDAEIKSDELNESDVQQGI